MILPRALWNFAAASLADRLYGTVGLGFLQCLALQSCNYSPETTGCLEGARENSDCTLPSFLAQTRPDVEQSSIVLCCTDQADLSADETDGVRD